MTLLERASLVVLEVGGNCVKCLVIVAIFMGVGGTISLFLQLP